MNRPRTGAAPRPTRHVGAQSNGRDALAVELRDYMKTLGAEDLI